MLDGRGRVLADVQAQNSARSAVVGLAHVAHEGVQTVVVKAQAVDQRMGAGQAIHAWLGITGLGQRRYRAHLDEAKAHGAECIDAAGVFV